MRNFEEDFTQRRGDAEEENKNILFPLCDLCDLRVRFFEEFLTLLID